jgi:hypothetical protein
MVVDTRPGFYRKFGTLPGGSSRRWRWGASSTPASRRIELGMDIGVDIGVDLGEKTERLREKKVAETNL